jgi:hypothetical protein
MTISLYIVSRFSCKDHEARKVTCVHESPDFTYFGAKGRRLYAHSTFDIRREQHCCIARRESIRHQTTVLW